MRGIPEERLKVIAAMPASVFEAPASEIINYLIAKECQELQEQWMTLDEFLKSGFIGKCWVNIAFTSYFANFNGIDFVENPCIESKFPVKHITHVMPIHKPEPPR